jgi:hypothetical protein
MLDAKQASRRKTRLRLDGAGLGQGGRSQHFGLPSELEAGIRAQDRRQLNHATGEFAVLGRYVNDYD